MTPCDELPYCSGIIFSYRRGELLMEWACPTCNLREEVGE